MSQDGYQTRVFRGSVGSEKRRELGQWIDRGVLSGSGELSLRGRAGSNKRLKNCIGAGYEASRVVKWGWSRVSFRPMKLIRPRTIVSRLDKITEIANCLMNAFKVVGDFSRGDDMVSILSVHKVIGR